MLCNVILFAAVLCNKIPPLIPPFIQFINLVKISRPCPVVTADMNWAASLTSKSPDDLVPQMFANHTLHSEPVS